MGSGLVDRNKGGQLDSRARTWADMDTERRWRSSIRSGCLWWTGCARTLNRSDWSEVIDLSECADPSEPWL